MKRKKNPIAVKLGKLRAKKADYSALGTKGMARRWKTAEIEAALRRRTPKKKIAESLGVPMARVERVAKKLKDGA